MTRKHFDFDEKHELRELTKDLKVYARTAVPHAVRSSLNTSAFLTRFAFQGAIREKMITRNKFTERRIGVDKARGTNLDTMEAEVGHFEPYMKTQEEGGIDKGAVPKPLASGEKRFPRLRLVRSANTMKRIQLARRGRRGSKRQRNAASIKMARKAGRKFVYLETSQMRGIFKISGGRRSLQVNMVWNMTKDTRIIKPTPTLGPAVERVSPKLDGIHIRSMKFQLRRRKLFGF